MHNDHFQSNLTLKKSSITSNIFFVKNLEIKIKVDERKSFSKWLLDRVNLSFSIWQWYFFESQSNLTFKKSSITSNIFFVKNLEIKIKIDERKSFSKWLLDRANLSFSIWQWYFFESQSNLTFLFLTMILFRKAKIIKVYARIKRSKNERLYFSFLSNILRNIKYKHNSKDIMV